jgi:hypothetical protein
MVKVNTVRPWVNVPADGTSELFTLELGNVRIAEAPEIWTWALEATSVVEVVGTGTAVAVVDVVAIGGGFTSPVLVGAG